MSRSDENRVVKRKKGVNFEVPHPPEVRGPKNAPDLPFPRLMGGQEVFLSKILLKFLRLT